MIFWSINQCSKKLHNHVIPFIDIFKLKREILKTQIIIFHIMLFRPLLHSIDSNKTILHDLHLMNNYNLNDISSNMRFDHRYQRTWCSSIFSLFFFFFSFYFSLASTLSFSCLPSIYLFSNVGLSFLASPFTNSNVVLVFKLQISLLP